MPSPYELYKGEAVTEISSTDEGRHVTLSEGLINHPTHADGFVDAKDPVTFGATADGYGVGVAFNGAAAATDLIAIDTEGIWNLSVVAVNDEGNSAVQIGDIIFINRTTCILSKISSDTTNLVFGYALDTIASGQTSTIAVKVHWDPWYDVYRDYTGTGNEDALLIEVDDAATGDDGINRGLHVDYHNTDDKTGTHEVNGIGVDMIHTQDVPYDYGIAIYHAESGNPTIGFKAALSIYMDNLGTNVGALVGIDVGLAGGTNTPADRHAFMRLRNHSAGSVPDSVFLIEASPCATFLLDMPHSGLPWAGVDCSVAANERIQVRTAGNTRYIRLYSS